MLEYVLLTKVLVQYEEGRRARPMTSKKECKPCPSREAIEKLQQLERIFGTMHSYIDTKIVGDKRVSRK
jgi:hypothetical protein